MTQGQRVFCKIPPHLPFRKGGITPLWQRGARGDFLKICLINYGLLSNSELRTKSNQIADCGMRNAESKLRTPNSELSSVQGTPCLNYFPRPPRYKNYQERSGCCIRSRPSRRCGRCWRVGPRRDSRRMLSLQHHHYRSSPDQSGC
jgi:hypothetical protein